MSQPAQHRILIVEDEPSFRRIYRDALEHAGYEVAEAADGQTAWKMIGRGKYDLILLDVIIPKMDGFTLLQKVRAEPKFAKIPVIILSVLGGEADIHSGLQVGANDYVIKGAYTPETLLGKITQLIKESKK